jgi:hypothetical protein
MHSEDIGEEQNLKSIDCLCSSYSFPYSFYSIIMDRGQEIDICGNVFG